MLSQEQKLCELLFLAINITYRYLTSTVKRPKTLVMCDLEN